MNVSNSEAEIKNIFSRLQNLCKSAAEIRTDMSELQREITSKGFSHSALKKLANAMLAADEGNQKPLERLKADNSDTALYMQVMGVSE